MISIPSSFSINGTSEKSPKDIFTNAILDLNAKIKPQPIAISIGTNRYKGNSYPTPYASYGDFSCIVGASKSKKTFLKSLITACYIGGNAIQYASEITGHNQSGKLVIDIDTEQSEFHAQRVFRRVGEMVGNVPEFYKCFSLRKYSAFERLQFIEWLIMESEYRSNIGLLNIDGVADLVDDVNDLEASNNVTQSLLKWSDTAKCHIITVLHRNFQSNKPTGHLGSSVLKKAETVLFVEKDGDRVIVKPEYTRNISFEPFVFEVDKNWLPTVTENNYVELVEMKPKKNKDIPF
jgi:hypothetical protein